ncbi:hypothetical protein [Mucilaginibacter sp.]|uniref:hypothetical protein n=1 Tax=Mucilaginibacter sp. TaxID=1882438 RepID=UPI003AFF90FD
MKTASVLWLMAGCFGSVFTAGAQSKSIKNLKKSNQNIVVDGQLKDWGDSLDYYNPGKKLHYGLAENQENLYFAIRIEDRGQQEQAMRNGITLAFNPEGKKKETYSLTFPSPDQDENSLFIMPKADHAITEQQLKQEDLEEHRKADLLKLRDIRVKGFPDVETDHITTANTYGIKTVLQFDDGGALVYEAAIPVKMLHSDLTSKPWVFDIRINSFNPNSNKDGLKPPGENGGMNGGGMRGGGMRGGRGGIGNIGNPSDGQGNAGKAVEIRDKFVW